MSRPPLLDAAIPASPIRPRYALLVNPFYPKDPNASFGKHVLTPTLALTSVAGATPANWRVRYWDEKASVPFLYNAQQQIFISYEDPQSLAAKCRFVLSQGLGGVMFWEYSNDPSGTLLRAINDSLREHSTKGAKP